MRRKTPRVLNRRTHRLRDDAADDRYDRYVGRPGPFGNPFEIGKDGTRDEVIAKHNAWLALPAQAALVQRIKEELRGFNLVCWCVKKVGMVAGERPLICHAQTLLEIANE